jgi:hypothetical protein
MLRAQGLSWAAIGERLDIGEGTAYRAAHSSSKNPKKSAAVTCGKHAAD